MNQIQFSLRNPGPLWLRMMSSAAVWGPGLLVMLADMDVGNVVTAAQSGAQWGYRLVPILLSLIPLLYAVQELTVRLGIFTGRGQGELIREKFGVRWAAVSAIALTVATVGSTVTEFTGLAGVGEIYGLPRGLTLSVAATALLCIAASGSYRRMERIFLGIGLLELAFFLLAWHSHPKLSDITAHVRDLPLRNRDFLYLAAALIGATFSPWTIFYQQSAVAEKKLRPRHQRAARWDTAIGAMLTQLLTAAVLISTAAVTMRDSASPLDTVGKVVDTLTYCFSGEAGRLIVCTGIVGAAMTAAVVSSLGMAWGIGEIAGFRRSLEHRPWRAPWFYGVYALCVAGSATLVWLVPDLVWLNVSAQVVNALMLPLSLGFLIVLAAKSLPEGQQLRGVYFWLLVIASALTCVVGMVGGLSGLV
jgi:NRAMP (natural resistance-associated macrophage protein)-like metal ion transporter